MFHEVQNPAYGLLRLFGASMRLDRDIFPQPSCPEGVPLQSLYLTYEDTRPLEAWSLFPPGAWYFSLNFMP